MIAVASAVLVIFGSLFVLKFIMQVGLGGKDVRVKLEQLTSVPPSPVGLKAGDYGRRFIHDGLERSYEIHVPSQAAPRSGYPIVLVFHGGGSYSAAVRYESRFDEVSNRYGFIVVYPSGTNRRLYPKDRLVTWNDGRKFSDGRSNDIDDVGFIAALLDDLAEFVRIDALRVFAAGYSNGAQFVYRLVKQLPKRIAAIAAIAGQRGPDEFFPPPARPVSVLQFAGLEDKVGPYNGGSPAVSVEFITVLKPVPEVVREWAEFDGCSVEPARRTIGSAEEVVFGPGREGSEVVLWVLKNGGHTWPGGNVLPNSAAMVGETTHAIFGSELMWKFFERHPLDKKYAEESVR